MSDASLIDQIARAIAPGIPVEAGHGADAIATDARHLDCLLTAERASYVTRLWTNPQCLVTTRRFAAMARFPVAAAASAACGWPVYVRPSGGTTVAHRPGMLNVSCYHIHRAAKCDISAGLQDFADRLVTGLSSLGFPAETGWTDDSHCDGRFNITLGSRKIAGTASLVRNRGAWTGMLAHATLWISGNIEADIVAIEAFERDLGLSTRYSLDAHCSLAAHGFSPGRSF